MRTLSPKIIIGVCPRTVGSNRIPFPIAETCNPFSVLMPVGNRRHHASSSEGYGGVTIEQVSDWVAVGKKKIVSLPSMNLTQINTKITDV